MRIFAKEVKVKKKLSYDVAVKFASWQAMSTDLLTFLEELAFVEKERFMSGGHGPVVHPADDDIDTSKYIRILSNQWAHYERCNIRIKPKQVYIFTQKTQKQRHFI